MNSASSPELHAVIGVRFSGNETYYVKRSKNMRNFPSVWSLLSIQFDPSWLTHPEDLKKVQILMEKMSRERLGGVPVRVKKWLISGSDSESPVGCPVHLHLYEIDLLEEPRLNSQFYTDAAWLTAQKYELFSAGQACGLCLRLWSDYAWMAGLTDRPFVAREKQYA